MVWGHITVGAQLTVYTICWLPCLSKYAIVANFVLYVWAGLGWRSAGGDSLGPGLQFRWRSPREGQTDRRQQPADTQPWEQGKGEAGQSTNVARGWRYRKLKAQTRRAVLSKLISCSRNHGTENSSNETSGGGRRKNWERKPWESTRGSTGVREGPEGKRRGQKWREAKKKKGDKSIANNGATVAKEGWLWQKHFSLLIQLTAVRDSPCAARAGHRARADTQGLICNLPHACPGKGGSGKGWGLPCAGMDPTAAPGSPPTRDLSTSEIHGIWNAQWMDFSSWFYHCCKKSAVDLLGYSWKPPLQPEKSFENSPQTQIWMAAFQPQSFKVLTKLPRIVQGHQLSFSISRNAGLILLRTFRARI